MNTHDEKYRTAILICARRYRGMAMKEMDLYDFAEELILRTQEGWSIPKMCRWLGYIQGCLIERGYTTVQRERDYTREYFTPLDQVNS